MGMTTQELRQRWPHGQALIDQIRQDGDTIFLAFSCGKDSIAAWLTLRDHFPKIIPFYKYRIPGLEFVEASLRYYEDFFGTRIVRLPHPALYRWLGNLCFQAPQNWPLCLAAQLPQFDDEDLPRELAKDRGLDPVPWTAIGTRAADNLQRRMAFLRTGPVNTTTRTFAPVWDLGRQEQLDLFRRHNIKLPASYRVFRRSFDGLNWQFLHAIKQHWPRDYARILEFFPLAELEILRHDYYQQSLAH